MCHEVPLPDTPQEGLQSDDGRESPTGANIYDVLRSDRRKTVTFQPLSHDHFVRTINFLREEVRGIRRSVDLETALIRSAKDKIGNMVSVSFLILIICCLILFATCVLSYLNYMYPN